MATRLELQRGFLHGLLGVLGYEMCPNVFVRAAGRALPVLGSVARTSGRAELILLEVPPLGGEDETALNPLQATFVPEQFAGGEIEPLLGVTVEDAITRHVFSLPEPPRWVVVVAAEIILVVERGKWPFQRLLAFDLPQIFADRDLKRVRYTAILLHREHLAPALSTPNELFSEVPK